MHSVLYNWLFILPRCSTAYIGSFFCDWWNCSCSKGTMTDLRGKIPQRACVNIFSDLIPVNSALNGSPPPQEMFPGGRVKPFSLGQLLSNDSWWMVLMWKAQRSASVHYSVVMLSVHQNLVCNHGHNKVLTQWLLQLSGTCKVFFCTFTCYIFLKKFSLVA